VIRWVETPADVRKIRRLHAAILMRRSWEWIAGSAVAAASAGALLGLPGALGATGSSAWWLAVVLAPRFPRDAITWTVDADGVRGERGPEREHLAWSAFGAVRVRGRDALLAIGEAGVIVPGGATRLAELAALAARGSREPPPPPAGPAAFAAEWTFDPAAIRAFPSHPRAAVRLGAPGSGWVLVLAVLLPLIVVFGSEFLRRWLVGLALGAAIGFVGALGGLLLTARRLRRQPFGEEAGVGAWRLWADDAGVWIGGPRWSLAAPWARVDALELEPGRVVVAFRNGAVRVIPESALGGRAAALVAWGRARGAGPVRPDAGRGEVPATDSPWVPPR
jgi:hypothetical protein